VTTYSVEYTNDLRPAERITAAYYKIAEGFIEFRDRDNKPLRTIAAGTVWAITTETKAA
jgi:hypothetical protein